MSTKDGLFGITDAIHIGQHLDSVKNKIAILEENGTFDKELFPYKASYKLIDTSDATYFNVTDNNEVCFILIFSENADVVEMLLNNKYGRPHSRVCFGPDLEESSFTTRGWLIEQVWIVFSSNSQGKKRIVVLDSTVPRDFLIDYKKNKWYREDDQ